MIDSHHSVDIEGDGFDGNFIQVDVDGSAVSQ